MTLTKKLFSPNGRFRRRQYWFYSLATTAAFLAALLLVVSSPRIFGFPRTEEVKAVHGYVLLFLCIPFLWMGICITAKRCHDRNKSGWYQLYGLVPPVGWVGLVIELGFADGTRGDNRFGPSPKGVVSNRVATVFR
ncbi:MAG: DUF805 domain-containing protein [Alphaproteobacteria bacterium]|nr:DUF805 domain-containing protein [Alphaproteobacteria bacterium]